MCRTTPGTTAYSCGSAIRDGPPDGDNNNNNNNNNDNNNNIMEHWYIKPAELAPLHAPSVIDFYTADTDSSSVNLPLPRHLYYHSTRQPHIALSGCHQKPQKPPQYLPNFLSSIWTGHIPAGNCDLSPDSPHDEVFPRSRRAVIHNAMFQWYFPELSDDPVFVLTDTSHCSQILLVVHEPLSSSWFAMGIPSTFMMRCDTSYTMALDSPHYIQQHGL